VPSAAEPLAIVGIGCRLPGGIETPNALWNALTQARDLIDEIPESRWSQSAFHHPNAAVTGMTCSRWAGLVDHPEQFDAAFFGITPREAQRLDPQQRWFLEATWRALEDAGQRLEDLRGRSIGVYVGCSSSDYGEIQRRWHYHADLHTNTGAAVSLIANRVSHAFDFRGPSLVVDTACSSSLVALDIGASAIRNGQCEAIIVGGANALFMPEATIGFSKASMLARDGRCKAFDARADGYVRAEGALALLLKPLARALADGDRIYACLLSTAVNQDGQTPGITMPSGSQQKAMIETAYDGVVDPQWVGGVEAHGTGTPVGDPIEAQALGSTLGRGRSADNALWIGSIKTNLGHLEPASGAAGLAKLALSLWRGRLSPNLHFQRGNPDIDFASLGLRVVTSNEPWPVAPDGRCYGGVNSFGFGGTNAHAVLASAPTAATNRAGSSIVGPILWPVSARNGTALQTSVTDTHEYLKDLTEADLRHHSVAQSRRRSSHSHRLALVADHRDELLALLRSAKPNGKTARDREQLGRCLFIFSGQGSQWSGMASDLADVGPVAADMAERIAQLMPRIAGRPVLQALQEPDPEHVDRTDVVQPLLFIQQLALAAQLDNWGIKADAVCGHSVGEIAAACWAGALTIEDAVSIVIHRSQLQEKTRGSGAMAAIGMPIHDLQERLLGYRDLHMAAVNSPAMATVAGDLSELKDLSSALTGEGMFVHRLPMPYAFHSPHMEGLRADLLAALVNVAPQDTKLPFFSTVSGRDESGLPLDAEYWWKNLREPVLFADAVSAAIRSGCRYVVELGPQPALLRLAADCAVNLGATIEALPTLQRGLSAKRALLETLGQAWCHGLEPNWAAVYPGPCPHQTLPIHPWQRQTHWLEAPAVRAYRTQSLDHPLLGRRIYGAGARWEVQIDLARLPDLADHRIRGDSVMPAAAYVEQMLSVGHTLFGNVPVVISHLELDRMLVLDRPRSMSVVRDEISARTIISSEPDKDGDDWPTHAHARVLPSAGTLQAPSFPIGQDEAGEPSQAVSVDQLYRRLEQGGNHYGPRFRCVRNLHTDGQQAWATLALDSCSFNDLERYRFHPALLDAALQVVLELLRLDDRLELYLPVGVDRIEVSRAVGGKVYCLVRNAFRGDKILGADIFIYDQSHNPIAILQGCRCRAIATNAAQDSAAEALAWQWEQTPADPVAPKLASWRLFGFTEAEVQELKSHVAGDCTELLSDTSPQHEDLVCWFRLNDADPIQSTRSAVLALVQFVQQLPGSNVQLHVVTESATMGHSSGVSVSTAAAAIWALGRSLLTEGVVAISGLTDLEVATETLVALSQIGADLVLRAEEVAWRGGQRFQHRLMTRPFQSFSERTVPTVKADAYTLTLADHAGFDALRWHGRTPAVPQPGQITIAVEASGLNFRDVLKTLDLYPLDRSEWRWLGDECAGRVTAIGAGVEGFNVGDPVVAIAPACIASDVVADARLVVPRPPTLSAETSAGVPIAFLTAWYGLVECARLQAGETVLIHAAAGGVGQAAVQIARWVGARVLATASIDKQPIVTTRGADAVFNSRDLSFAEGIRGVAPDGVDVVLNSLAGEALLHSVELLKPFGRFVELGKRDIFANRPIDLRALRDNRAFFTVDLALWLQKSPEIAGQRLRQVMHLFEQGELHTVQTRTLPVRSVAEAFRLMAQGQHVGKLVLRIAADSAPAEVRDPRRSIIRPDSTYLITGGTSGFGLLIARVMADAGARHLVLVSRRGQVSDSDQSLLEKIRAHGVAIYQRACDLGDVNQTSAILAQIRGELPPIRGIVHGAMALDDVPVVGLDADRLDRVLRPKTWGAWNLSALTEQDDLDFFVMQSSVAASLGAPGQSNYVVANHLLDVLATQRRACGKPAQVIAWGPIADMGAVARSDRLQHYFERLGFTLLDYRTIENAFRRIIGSNEKSVIIAKIDWLRLAASISRFDSDTRFGQLVNAVETQGDDNLAQVLRAAEPQRRRKLLNDLIKTQAAQVLGVSVSEIPENRPLGDIGLDSLMAFELSAQLDAKLKSRLPLSALQGNRTVEAVAEQLDRVLSRTSNRNEGEPAVADNRTDVATSKAADIRLRYLAPTLLVDRHARFDAAALTYIPEQFATKGGLGPAELQAALGSEPFLSATVDAPIGRVGTFMLPLRASELFLKPEQTRDLAFRAIELAAQQGSRVMTLTGLLPAATGYGEALMRGHGHAFHQSVTTGHALTTATIIANLTDLLKRCGRRLEDECIAIVGLGSVGRSVLELLFRTLPHPRGLVLCDLYIKADDLEALRQRIDDEFQFDRDIEIVAGDAGLPAAVRQARLIVSAVDRIGVIDPLELSPGTILLDDSYPPTFDPVVAWRRMNERKDVVIASGGFARMPGPVRETFYVPSSARPFLRAYGEENFICEFQREPCDYTACIFAGPLALQDSTLRAESGIPTPTALEAFYRAFERYQLASAAPHCNGRLIPEELFAQFKERLD
jgi:acyl transferase domain-containing protein/NADPH-dependent curcumin reductase CurA/predicted amino acid dehydrogenase/short-subunit dehydrogenase/acyl carrier protein